MIVWFFHAKVGHCQTPILKPPIDSGAFTLWVWERGEREQKKERAEKGRWEKEKETKKRGENGKRGKREEEGEERDSLLLLMFCMK